MPSIPANNSEFGSSQPQAGGLQTPRDTSPPSTRSQAASSHAASSQAASADQAETQATFNEAGVRSAQANWLDGLNNLLYAPGSGYLNQRGAAAVGSYDALQGAINKLNQQAQDSLANDTQRAIFTDAAAPIINAAQARIQQHAQTQGRVYDADASRARALSARDLAVNAWNPAPGADNGNYRQGAAILHNELENQFRHTWGDPGTADNQTLWNHFLQHGPNGDDGMASLSTGVINRLLANDQPHDAQAFLGQVQHTLPAPTRDKLKQFVTAGLDQHAGLSAALKVQATGNDPAAQQQKLDTLRDDGHISTEAHTIATHKIQADQAAQAAAQQQNDAQTLQKVWALKNANPNAALTDLSAADYAYLKSRGLDGNALAILQSHPATDDPGLFNELHRMATQDPVTFGKSNLVAESGKLSRAHMQTLLSLQDAVNKQDPQAIQGGKRIDMTVNALMASGKAAAADSEPAHAGTDIHASGDQADKLEAGLRDHLLAAQQSDPKLTLDDLYGSGASYLKDWSLDGDGSAAPTDAEQARNRALFGPFDSSASSAASEADQALPKGATPAEGKAAAPAAAPHDNGGIVPPIDPGFSLNHALSAGSDSFLKNYSHFSDGYGARTTEQQQKAAQISEGGVVRARKGENLLAVSERTSVPIELLMYANGTSDPVDHHFAAGALIKLPLQSASQRDRELADERSHSPVIDVDAATKQLQAQATGENDYTGWCARHVYDAINAGLQAEGKPPIKAQDRLNAFQGGETLEKIGYRKWTTTLDGYAPKKGDVVVIQQIPGHKNGHMAMFDGKHWISDTVQTGKSGMWSNLAFVRAKAPFAIYRP